MKNLTLNRPLVFLDVESTGVNPDHDRIVQIAAVRYFGGGAQKDEKSHLIHPGQPIPPEATQVHGITDEMVKDAPSFRQLAGGLLKFIEGADLAAYNARFDFSMLQAEFRRVGIEWSANQHRVLDPFRMLQQLEPRDLGAVYQRQTGKDLVGAHDALADARATVEVLEHMIEGYDLPGNVDDLLERFQEDPADSDFADPVGRRFRWRFNEPWFAFGKYHKSLKNVALTDPDYLRWMLRSSFEDDTKALISDALAGKEIRRDQPAEVPA